MRAALTLLIWLVACPVWAQEYPNEKPPLVDPARIASFVFSIPLAEDIPASPADQQQVVTVLVAYSQDKWRSLGSTRAKVLAHAQSIVDQWNTARLNSMDSVATIMPMELGGVMLTSYTTGVGPNGDSMLNWMTYLQSNPVKPGGYEEIMAEVNRIGADNVLAISGTDACGLSYVCASSQYPFSSAEIGCSVGNLSGIHEMGHAMCGNHEPESECNQPTCPGYAHGGGWPKGPGLSVVERDPLTYPREGGNRVLWWTNPRKTRTVNGVTYAIGDAAMRDNARAIGERSPLTANFRVTTGAGPLQIPSIGSLKATVHN